MPYWQNVNRRSNVSSESIYHESPKMAVFILDSFAVLAYLKGEPSGQRVREVLGLAASGRCQAVFSLTNLGEVVYIIERQHGFVRAQEVLALLEHEPFNIIEADRSAVLMAAHIKANYPLSYADCFVVAAAQAYSATVLTGDPELQVVEGLVDVEWLVN
jgi:ribonuclease VapC